MFLDDFGWLFWLAGPSIAYLILVGYLIYVPLIPDPSAEDPKSIQPVILNLSLFNLFFLV